MNLIVLGKEIFHTQTIFAQCFFGIILFELLLNSGSKRCSFFNSKIIYAHDPEYQLHFESSVSRAWTLEHQFALDMFR